MPTLQTLADQGIRFINGYAQPVCSPTRAAILTGRQAWRTGVGNAGDELQGTDRAKRCIVTEAFGGTGVATGRSIRMESDPAYPGSHPDFKLIIFGDPTSTNDTPTFAFYNVVADANEGSPLNISALNAAEQAAYNALIAKDAALGGAYSAAP